MKKLNSEILIENNEAKASLKNVTNKIEIELQPETTPLVVDLQTNELSIESDVFPEGIALDAGLESNFILGIKDVRINDTTIVNNKIANIVLGDGLVYDNGLTLSTENLPQINPKALSIDEQEGLSLIIIDNGSVKQVSENNLDYSKITVQDEKDLTKIRNKDFLFVRR